MARPLRIVSLLPSTTEIVGALGLQHALVGITHECDVCPDEAGLAAVLATGQVSRVTTSEINPHAMSQGEIDETVKQSVSSGLSLYGLKEDKLRACQPTVLLTQALCSVCAPAYDDVAATCKRLGAALAGPSQPEPTILNCEPGTLEEVCASFGEVARVCGAEERGAALQGAFQEQLRALREAVAGAGRRPSVLLLEWLDPPFDGGHWVPDQIRQAGCEPAGNGRAGAKSKERSWEEVAREDPDVVVVACCGFDLARNRRDAERHLLAPASPLAGLRAARTARIFVLDGNRYFARPSPSLAAGAALVARCAFSEDAAVVARLDALPWLPAQGEAWARLPTHKRKSRDGQDHVALQYEEDADVAEKEGLGGERGGEGLPQAAADVEHAIGGLCGQPSEDMEDCWRLHREACQRGDTFYTDPSTGYMVFTEVAHKDRGKCCGSGCRHCPYNHQNVRDSRRAGAIQQPAWLHRAGPLAPKGVKVLFFSGGKDSFLTVRAMVKAGLDPTTQLVLLTTFDAVSRRVANQEVGVDQILRQAKHLGVGLVGVPLHAGVEYLDLIKKGVEVVAAAAPVSALVFGDLHLQHIKAWRDDRLASLNIPLEYPVWHASYTALMDDLEQSGVRCKVSNVTVSDTLDGALQIGALFDRALFDAAERSSIDSFGENGEFHSLAMVWEVEQRRALH